MARADSLDEPCDVEVGRRIAPRKVGEQLRIRQLENPLEAGQIGAVERRERRLGERLEHRVELAHPAPAPPPQTRDVRVRQSRRSAIIFLISAIALPGFRSFGHACVQFRIV